MNEAGLAVGLTMVYPTIVAPGLNAGVLVRCLLERCATIEEALRFLTTVPIASQQTIMMADQPACAVKPRQKPWKPENPSRKFSPAAMVL